jgi:ADP-ribosylglycohydrolase
VQEKILSAVMGHCVGDALGVPVEFLSREELKQDPVKDMRGHGTYNQPEGTWSDDTSMTLCTLDSLSEGIDYKDIMDKFLAWYINSEYTPFGETFDIGRCTSKAIYRYDAGEDPLYCGGADERENGNGSLMRILPVLFYLQKTYGENWIENEESFEIIHSISALTHAHKRSMTACGIYLTIADYISKDYGLKEAVELGIEKSFNYYTTKEGFKEELKYYERIQDENFYKLPEEEIQSTGYVVHSMESSIWCLLNTETYKDCVLKAVNLGEDTDTTAAIAGGLAGLHYGYENIPEEWLEKIQKREFVEGICKRFKIQ